MTKNKIDEERTKKIEKIFDEIKKDKVLRQDLKKIAKARRDEK